MEKEKRICPVCGNEYTEYPALSRKDNATEICPACGIREALEDFTEVETKKMSVEDRGIMIMHAIDGADLTEIATIICAMIELVASIAKMPTVEIAEGILETIHEVHSESEV